MRIILAAVVVVAAIWVWHNHITTDNAFCVPEPAQVCLERPPTTQPD